MLLITALFFYSIFSPCFGVTVTIGYNGPVTEGSEARLTCDYTSSIGGLPTFRWQELVNGLPVIISLYQSGVGSVDPDYTDRFSVEGDSTLVITNNSRSDNGRIYQCEVTVIGNSPPEGTDELTLSVAFLGTMMFDITSPVTEGESVMFVCSVNANPDPVIVLYKDESEEIIRETTTNLTQKIDSVEKSDGGNYKCKASNVAGSDTSQVKQLDVYCICEHACEHCKNGGTCSVLEGSYICSCTNDFNGLNCSYCIYKDGCDLEEGDNLYNYGNGTCECICGVGRQFNYVTNHCEKTLCNKQCMNRGACVIRNNVEECECPRLEGEYCEINQFSAASSSCTGVTIGMFFVGIFVGAFGVMAGLIGYTRIKQKTGVDNRSMNKRKQDTYMEYTTDRPTGNDNQTYQDLQHKEEEIAYVNVKPGKKKY